MKSKALCLGIVCALLVLAVIPLAHAGECKYGTVEAWARTLNEDGGWGEWKNATVHERLQTHEPFQVKVRAATKVDCTSVDLYLIRAGTTEAYEVVDGPSDISGVIPRGVFHETCNASWSKTYTWTVRPTGNWTRGTAVLNVRGGFYRGGYKNVDFTVIAAYIQAKEWQDGGGDTADSGHNGGSIPGCATVATVASILVALAVYQTRHTKWQE